MNISEFAKLCGVSQATVSRYFSGSAGMSPALSERIRRLAGETGYQPSARYQRRKSGPGGPIVVVSPYWRHRFQTDMLAELQRYCDELKQPMATLCCREYQNPAVSLQQIRAMEPAGIVLQHEGRDATFCQSLSDMRLPMVMCGGLSATREAFSVRVDDLGAAYDGASYLLRLGHRRIGVISDKPEAVGTGSQRIMGCRKALSDAGLALKEEQIAYAWYSFEDGRRGMEALLERRLGLTAVFVFSDEMAAGAMAALYDHGLAVPGDMSLLGFDNSSQALETRPMLSTVAQPIELIARRSVDMLLEGRHTPAEAITLPHSLAVRGSCRAL